MRVVTTTSPSTYAGGANEDGPPLSHRTVGFVGPISPLAPLRSELPPKVVQSPARLGDASRSQMEQRNESERVCMGEFLTKSHAAVGIGRRAESRRAGLGSNRS